MIVVSNTTPLIGLACIDRFDLLRQLFGTLHVARAVYAEAVIEGREGGGARREVTAAKWIQVLDVQDRLAVEILLDEMDIGEAETIVLARELGADWVLMDEKKGRRKLAQLGIDKIGTVGILLKAKEIGLLSVIRPEIERLRVQGFSLSHSVVEAVLQQAGERASVHEDAPAYLTTSDQPG
jgi:predicted nucleic acid-binding protein